MQKTKEERIKEYQLKREARIERFKQLAQSHSQKAESRYSAFKRIGDCIPMGQPILVGHHSERAHRADIKRMDSHLEKMSEHLSTAKYYQNKAASASDDYAIRTDDPEYLEKITARLDQLIQIKEAYKKFNLTWKKEGLNKAMSDYPFDKNSLFEIIKHYASYSDKKRLPGYALTNINQNIRRYQQKKEWALQNLNHQPQSFKIGEIEVTFEDSYWKVFFPSIPDENLRTKLKKSPLCLKWSRNQKAWVRKHTESTNKNWESILKETLQSGDSQC